MNEDLSNEEKKSIKNLLDVEPDNGLNSSIFGIYKEINLFEYWTLKTILVLGILICVIKILFETL
ncbi:hypothetical protein SAMN05444267_1005161 [Chryseobacterium polytrichastri]|uniref:Uncharacterized protein n=1 Tax=Chryseobacterium polytrichastri TaxID=1302687 RepID=A0A1M6TPL7_9FLAO|nr:hypothetical protein SAMN05444267_1005161 [Chryseobacterium polytrichastri]